MSHPYCKEYQESDDRIPDLKDDEASERDYLESRSNWSNLEQKNLDRLEANFGGGRY